MRHATGHVPVPDIVATEEGENPIAVLSFARGQAIEPVLDESGADLPADLVQSRFETVAALAATLHAIDVQGLADETVRSPAAELRQFGRIAAAGTPEFRDLGERAGAALERAVPGPWRVSLVHGDYRLGNVLFDGDQPTAVVDWEIWTLGDPRVDLGWLATYADHDRFPGIARTDVELPGAGHVVDAYASAVGQSVPDADWFLRLGAFRIGAIMSHNLHRHRTGRYVDPYQETLPATIERLLDIAAGA